MKTEEIIADALKVLKDGGTILYPTDTVWGLGCDATNPDAVKKIYDIKHRADSKSLVLLACDLDMIARYVKKIPDIAIDLVQVNDKPMTLIYPGADTGLLAGNVVAEDGSVGIRIPLNDFCVQLVRRMRRPLVSTSANISGEPTAKTYTEIPEEIRSAVDYIVDPALEASSTGIASQIIKVELDGQVKIIRP